MTVQKLYVKNKYYGDGANTVFPITFEWAKKHPESIQVWVRNNAGVLTKTDNFLLKTSSNEDIWNVVYPSVGDPLGQGETITIVRELSLLQVLNLVNQGPFFAEDVEITFDELVMMIQQLNEKLARSFKVAVDIDGENTFDTTVPIEPGKSFRVKDDGTGFEVTEDPAQVLPLAKSELEAVKREHAEAVQDLTVIKDEVESAKTEAQKAVNVADGIAATVQEKAEQVTTDTNYVREHVNNIADVIIKTDGWVTPQMFYKATDGNNWQPAIQAAIDSKKPVFIPSGNYRLNAPIVIKGEHIAYDEAKGYKGYTIVGTASTKLIATTNNPCIRVYGSYSLIKDLVLTFDAEIFANYDSGLLQLEALNNNPTTWCYDNTFQNIKMCSAKNIYTLPKGSKFSGDGIRLYSDGANPMYLNKFIGCTIYELYRGIAVLSNSSMGINANEFDVNIFYCNYSVYGNGGGNNYRGCYQASPKMTTENNVAIYMTGTANIFDLYCYDVYPTTDMQEFAYVSGRNNIFLQAVPPSSVLKGWERNKFNCTTDYYKRNDTKVYAGNILGYDSAYESFNMMPIDNSLRNTQVTDLQLIVEGASVVGYNGYPTTQNEDGTLTLDISRMVQASASYSRPVSFDCTDNAKFKFRFVLPTSCSLESVFVEMGNSRKKPSAVKLSAGRTSFEDVAYTQNYDVDNFSQYSKLIGVVYTKTPYYETQRYIELEIDYNSAGRTSFAYLAAVADVGANGLLTAQ